MAIGAHAPNSATMTTRMEKLRILLSSVLSDEVDPNRGQK
jgi:hypothetical protein